MSRQVLTYPDLPAVLTQAAGDLRYLPLTGGTVTGQLEVAGASGQYAMRNRDDNAAGFLIHAQGGNFYLYDRVKTTNRLTVSSLGTFAFTADANQISATFSENVRFLSGKPLLWQDPTNNYYLGWRMNNASPAQLTLCYWGGDTLIHFGTEGLHTPYLIAVPGNHMYLRGLNSGHNLYVDQWGSVLFTHMGGGLVGPASDNAYMLGQGGFRWTTVFAVTGAINTCSREVKEIVGTVDDTVALQQLMGLPAIYRFHYKHRVPVADADSEAPEEERFILETDTSKEFIGPVAEEMPMDMKVGEFEGGNVNTEGHLMASLRGAVKEYRDRITDLANRMTILEGRLPA